MHWGLGHGSGELIGGYFISSFGASKTFAIFGALSLVDMGLYMLVERFAPKQKAASKDGYIGVRSEDDQQDSKDQK